MEIKDVIVKLGGEANFAIKFQTIMGEQKFTNKLEIAHFLAQASVETLGFTKFAENLNYSVEGLLKTFARHRISEEDAKRYGRSASQPANVKAIGNCVYGGEWGFKNLGNTEINDGYDFAGVGVFHLTGRDNAKRYSMAVYNDLRILKNPAALRTMPDALLSAIWYWRSGDIGKYALKDDLLSVSKAVNLGSASAGGTPNGYSDRKKALLRIKTLMGI